MLRNSGCGQVESNVSTVEIDPDATREPRQFYRKFALEQQ